MVAEAVGAWSKQIKDTKELESRLQEAVKKVQGRQSAISNVFAND